MERASPTPADAAAVTEVLVAVESSLHGQAGFSQADLEDEWSELDLAENARVVRDGDRIARLHARCTSARALARRSGTSILTPSGEGSAS